jgi:hypothetical protein
MVKTKAKYSVWVITLLLSLICLSPVHGARRPRWIDRPPEDRLYLYVVGVATDSPTLEEGRRLAISNAVSEIVQYFGITSKVRFNEKRTELYTKVLDEFEATSRGAIIKGSFVEDWHFEEDRDTMTYDVFVLVRFPKEEITKEKARQKRENVQKTYLAKKSLREARKAEADGDITTAFARYTQALRVSQDLENGDLIRSQAEDYLRSLATRLKIEKVSGDNQQGRLFRGLEEPLVVRVVLKGAREEVPVKGLPLLFGFDQVTSGDLIPEARTDENGLASTKVLEIGSISNENVIRAGFDIDRILPPDAPSSIASLLRAKGVRFSFSSYVPKRDLRVIILIEERNLGKDMGESIIASELSSSLLGAGYRMIGIQDIGKTNVERLRFAIKKNRLVSLRLEYLSLADLIVSGSISTRACGKNPYGVTTSVADAHIRVISLEDGRIVAQKNQIGVPGFGKTHEEAGINAVRRAGALIARAIIEQLERAYPEGGNSDD